MARTQLGAAAALDLHRISHYLARQPQGQAVDTDHIAECRALNNLGPGSSGACGRNVSPDPPSPDSTSSNNTKFGDGDPFQLFSCKETAQVSPLKSLFGNARIGSASQGQMAVAQASAAAAYSRAATHVPEDAANHSPNVEVVGHGASLGGAPAPKAPGTKPKAAPAAPPMKRGPPDEWEVAPARRDAPGRRAYQRGSEQRVRETEQDVSGLKEAIAEYHKDKWSAQGERCFHAHLAWWARRCDANHLEPWPLTVHKVIIMGALLKAGRYRAFKQYMSSLRQRHVQLGHSWSDQLQQEWSKCQRSCGRHIGPPKKASTFPLEKLARIPDTFDSPGGPDLPCCARSASLVGAWRGLGEIELSTLRIKQVEFGPGPGCGTVNLELAASKTDHMALGKVRGHGCSCPSLGCPVRAVKRLHEYTSNHYHTTGQDGLGEAPLVLSSSGGFCEKDQIRHALVCVANVLGVKSKPTAHAMRAIGAQAMARAGLPLWKIQLFLRWGSSAVLGYLDEAPLAKSHSLAREVSEGLDLAELREDLLSTLAERVKDLTTKFLKSDLDQFVRDALEEKCIHVGAGSHHTSTREAMEELGPEMLEATLQGVQAHLQSTPAASLESHGPPIKFVLNADPNSRKVHRVKSSTKTFCGWPWAAHPLHRIVGDKHDYEVCRTCCK